MLINECNLVDMEALRSQRKAVLVVLFCGAVFISPLYAGVIDPSPVFKAPESPQQESLSSPKSTDFFCPLSKKFYNPQEAAVETIILESVGEGYQGMVAVAEVIRNRTKLFEKDPDGICKMYRQFSCWNDPEKARRFLERHQEYRFMALMAWKQSEKSRLTGGATDYHATFVRPYWAKAYRVAARIGRHVFYVRQGNITKQGGGKIK